MRSSDFSRAPERAHAEWIVLTSHAYDSVADRIRGIARRRRLRRLIRATTGLFRQVRLPDGVQRSTVMIWARSFEDVENLVASGLIPAPEDSTDAAWTKLLAAEPVGYTNGVWRAEGDVLAHIERFTPLPGEQAGPPVVRPKGR